MNPRAYDIYHLSLLPCLSRQDSTTGLFSVVLDIPSNMCTFTLCCVLLRSMPADCIHRFRITSEHYSVVIMSTMASQFTSVSIVCTTLCVGANQRKPQSSVSLAFVRGSHWWAVNSPHKGPLARKTFPSDEGIMRHLYNYKIYSMRVWQTWWILEDDIITLTMDIPTKSTTKSMHASRDKLFTV